MKKIIFLKKRNRKIKNRALLYTILFLSGVGFFYSLNIQKQKFKAFAQKEEIPELEIEEINPTTYAFKTLDDNLIEIGTEKHSSPQPYLKINKWDGEVFLKIGIPFVTEEKPLLVGNKIRYSTVTNQQATNSSWLEKIFSKLFVQAQDTNPKVAIDFYPREPEEITEIINDEEHTFTQNEQGGVEFDTILYEKPEINEIIFPIETQGLKFYYQPPLDPEHPTWADTNGDGIADSFRPENVVGSYAVYHETQDNFFKTKEEAEKYRAGKAFHIYRPRLIDAQGKGDWAELHIDEVNDILAIILPNKFLNQATYPITIDPNFGYETQGASGICGTNIRIGCKFTNSNTQEGEGKSMSWANDFAFSEETVKLCLYDSSKNKINNGETEELTSGGADQWITHNFINPPSISGNTDYYLVWWTNNVNPEIKYDTFEGHVYTHVVAAYGSWPDSLPESDLTGKKFSIYCTYNPTKDIIVQATVSSWLSLQVSPTSTNITPDLVTDTGGVNIGSSTNITITCGTNSSSGYSLDIKSLNAALCHSTGCATGSISSASATIQAGTDGYGAEATSTDGDVTISTSYNHWEDNTVGGLETSDNDLADTSSPSSDDDTLLKFRAAATSTKPFGTYEDIITLTLTAGS